MSKIYTDRNLTVNALSEKGEQTHREGHRYRIDLTESQDGNTEVEKVVEIEFHQGPVPDNNLHGLTSEALLAILIHRTKYLDSCFPCDENKRAIAHMEMALASFEERTTNRIVRGVEGQNIV